MFMIRRDMDMDGGWSEPLRNNIFYAYNTNVCVQVEELKIFKGS